MKEKICGIYIITSPSGRKYVGSSKDIMQRWNRYRVLKGHDRQPKLYNSFQKYGFNNHTFDVFLQCKAEERFKWEHIIGVQFNVLDRNVGMNSSLPGYDDVPKIVSEETKEKISELNKGKNKRFGKDNTFYDKKHSDYTKKIISERRKEQCLKGITKCGINKNDNRKKVINIETGKIYDSISDCSKENNINDSTLGKFLRKGGDRMTKEFFEKCKNFRFLL